jgi:23S rRNA (adenine2503-C2)-methyltransferase
MIYFQSLTLDELAELLIPISAPRKRHRPRFTASPAAGAGLENLPASVEVSPEISEAEKLATLKRACYRAKQIFHWVYQRHVTDWEEMSDLSKDLRAWLKEHVEIYRLKQVQSHQALDGTHKFLWQLQDGKTIESVIIPAALQEKENMDVEASSCAPDCSDDEEEEEGDSLSHSAEAFAGARTKAALNSGNWSRLTACISSQVGCAMACKFCLTGVQGLDRHLQVHEIVTQIYELRRLAPITNIVFMGMGEPLHNLDNVAKACQILLSQEGLNFSKRKVTVSTSGLVPAIEELGKRVDVSLAISLNSSTDEQRSQIMPVNKKWNIAKLMEACRNYPLGSHRRITFEYVMLRDFNDSLEDAARVVKLLRGIPSKVNLIPFNEHSGSEFKRPSDDTVRKFQKYLMDRGFTATVRISRGRDILAACGQLRSIFGTARGTERHKDWAALKS